MGFRSRVREWAERPTLWLVAAVAAAWAGGLLCGQGSYRTAIVCLGATLLCGYLALRRVRRLRRRVDYLIDASLNNDFTYKFPVERVSHHEREINVALNRLVEHLEALAHNAQQNEKLLSLVINLVDTGIVVADAKGNVVEHNRAALYRLGLPVLTHVCQFPADLASLSLTTTHTSLRGEQLTLYTVNDLRRPLQNAEVESWEKLTRVLTHEIMNSLTPIHSIVGSLSQQTGKEEWEAAMEAIALSTRSLMDFVKNFRKFTILPEPQMKVVGVKPFLEKALLLASKLEGAQQIEFTLTTMPPDAMLYTDETLLNQVVSNILKNAVEAAPGKIAVSATIRKDESVEISIANNGEPIAPEIASQIFTPFFTTKPSGSGIGLSLSRRIVSRLGGTLTLSAGAVTRFTILL